MKYRFGRVHKAAMASFVVTMLAGLPVSSHGQNRPADSPAPAVAPAADTGTAADAKVVLRVGKEEVTKADMDEVISGLGAQAKQAIAKSGRRAVGEQYAAMMMLDQQAEKDHLDTSPEVRQRLEMERRQLLAQAEYQKMEEQIQITPDEISQYFDAHKAEFDGVKVYEILVRKKTANSPGLSAEEAQSKIEAIRKALTAGADIAKVKKEFSVPNDVIIDSVARTLRRGQLLPALEKQAFSLKDGEVSEPYQMPQAAVLFQVVSHQPADLKDVSEEIENDIRQEKLKDAVDSLRKSANVWMDDDYFAEPTASQTPAAEKPAAAPGPQKH